MSIRWDSESDWKNNQDSSGTVGRNGGLKQGYSRERPELSQGLVGYWPLHDDSATDYSGNGNHGSLSGGVTTGVAGKGGLTSYSFDGSDDYVNIGDDGVLDGMEAISISIWFKTDKQQGGGDSAVGAGLISKYIDDSGTGDDCYVVGLEGDRLEGRIYTGSGSVSWEVANPYADSEWHNYVVVYDGNEILVYFDGDQVGSETQSSSIQSTSAPLEFGVGRSSGGTNDYFNGALADVRIYDRALTPEEVQKLYEWGSSDFARPLNDSNSSSVVSRYALDGDATDTWGNNDGTDNTSTGYVDGVRGQSKDFNSSNNDYLRVDDASSLRIGGPLTVSLWVKFDSVGGTLISKGDSNNNNSINYRIRAGFDFGVYDGSWHRVNSTTSPQAGNWYHVTGVFDGNQYKIFVNGSLENQIQDSTTPPTDSGDWLAIGQNSEGGGHIDGRIDDVRIYGKALEASEIFDLYRCGTKGRDMRKQLVNY